MLQGKEVRVPAQLFKSRLATGPKAMLRSPACFLFQRVELPLSLNERAALGLSGTLVPSGVCPLICTALVRPGTWHRTKGQFLAMTRSGDRLVGTDLAQAGHRVQPASGRDHRLQTVLVPELTAYRSKSIGGCFCIDSKLINTGAAGGDRTHDPWLRRPILYPLSYSRNSQKG